MIIIPKYYILISVEIMFKIKFNPNSPQIMV